MWLFCSCDVATTTIDNVSIRSTSIANDNNNTGSSSSSSNKDGDDNYNPLL